MSEDVKSQETQTEPAAQAAATEADAPQAGTEASEQAPEALDPKAALERLQALEQEVKRLRAEAAKYRVKAKQTAQEAERAKTLEERVAEVEKAYKEMERRAFLAEVKAELMPALGGDQKRVEAALALAERDGLLTEEGVDVDALLERYPFLRPSEAKPTDKGANPPGGGKPQPTNLAEAIKQKLAG